VAIDNFGTKYSSFDYFKSYGVSELKLAPAYLSESDHDPGRAANLRAVRMAVNVLGAEINTRCSGLLSAAHTEAEIDSYVQRVAAAAAMLKREKLL
jgi:predicted signal transduction protein with EAL and GGDEF domain